MHDLDFPSAEDFCKPHARLMKFALSTIRDGDKGPYSRLSSAIVTRAGLNRDHVNKSGPWQPLRLFCQLAPAGEGVDFLQPGPDLFGVVVRKEEEVEEVATSGCIIFFSIRTGSICAVKTAARAIPAARASGSFMS